MLIRSTLIALAFLGLTRPLLGEPIYHSFPDTVFDVIRPDDPSAFACLIDAGQGKRQIWDKRVDGEPVVDAWLFTAHFTDGTAIEIAINPEFSSQSAAREVAEMFTRPLGQLPTSLRAGIKRFSVHDGRESFHAGTGGIVMYRQQALRRLEEKQLEESVFHEAVHASWDATHRLNPDWQAAQRRDGGFLTRYGAAHPEREDLPETAVFAFGLLHHPGRLPPVDSADIEAAIPNRLAYIAALLPPDQPLFYPVGPAPDCP